MRVFRIIASSYEMSKKNGEVKKPRHREKYNIDRSLTLLERNLLRFCFLKQTPNNL